jgi:hypothetical protein
MAWTPPHRLIAGFVDAGNQPVTGGTTSVKGSGVQSRLI